MYRLTMTSLRESTAASDVVRPTPHTWQIGLEPRELLSKLVTGEPFELCRQPCWVPSSGRFQQTCERGQACNRYKVNAASVFSFQYRLVWCPKYRKRILVDRLAKRLRALLYQKTNEIKVEIHALEIRKNSPIPLLPKGGSPLGLKTYGQKACEKANAPTNVEVARMSAPAAVFVAVVAGGWGVGVAVYSTVLVVGLRLLVR